MRLPQNLLFLMKSAALGGGIALSAGCMASATPAATTVAYTAPQPNVVYVHESATPVAQPQVVVQQPCVYVPAQPQPSTEPAPLQPAPSIDPAECLGCGMG